jgi:hypothetical protein
MKLLQEMLVSQDYNVPVLDTSVPKIGYIAMLGDQPIAACFLRRVECDVVAQIDGLTSNKHFGSVLRHEAISQIVETLINEAKTLKLQGLIAFTTDLTIVNRFEATGFITLNHNLLSLTF